MLRAAIYALISIFLITLVKMFAGVIMRGMSDAFKEESAETADSKGGELKKCVVCGTYAPKAIAPKVMGTDNFVCSDACARKYAA